MADFNVLEQMFGFLSRGNTGYADPLEQQEDFSQPTRRTQFNPTQGPADGKPTPVEYYIPGELDHMAREAGIASDDPYQTGAKLETWRRYGYSGGDERDRQRLRDFLERR